MHFRESAQKRTEKKKETAAISRVVIDIRTDDERKAKCPLLGQLYYFVLKESFPYQN